VDRVSICSRLVWYYVVVVEVERVHVA